MKLAICSRSSGQHDSIDHNRIQLQISGTVATKAGYVSGLRRGYRSGSFKTARLYCQTAPGPLFLSDCYKSSCGRHWFIPDECEYIHLPSWDSLLESKAQYWGRKPFLRVGRDEAVRLRKDILQAAVASFRPDAIFVDHLPLGFQNEFEEIIRDTPCLKYFVTRGVLNETENLRDLILGRQAHHYLVNYYRRIFVAADAKIVDFSRQYNLAEALRAKTIHVGYVVEHISRESLQEARAERGLNEHDIWVVASAGSGQRGEPLIEACESLASEYNDLAFDIVVGPRSGLLWRGSDFVVERGHARLHKESHRMPSMHAGADCVISSAGYNSMLETLQGNGKLLCFPYRKDVRDEQYRHAVLLKKRVELEVSTDIAELPLLFKGTIDALRKKRSSDQRNQLDFSGAANIDRIVSEDLNLDLEKEETPEAQFNWIERSA